MAKPFIGFALVSGYSFHGHNFYVLGITSESRGIVYGRKLPSDHMTNCRSSDAFYRFPEGTTAEYALAAEKRASEENARHIDGITEARRTVERLEKTRSLAVLDAAKGTGFDRKRPMAKAPEGMQGYFCTNCARATPRDFCPICGAPAPDQ